MFRDGDAVRARIAAHDCGRRKSLEREMVDSGDERLDHPHLSRLLPEVQREFAGEPHGHEDVRGRPRLIALLGRQVFQDLRLERPGLFPRQGGAALRVHRDDEQDPSHGATHRAGGLGPFDGAPRSAFRVAARVAFDAAFLEHEGLAALRALRIQAFPQQLRGVAALLLHLDVRLDGAAELVVRLHRRLDAGLLHADVPLDRLRDRVRDRVDALPMVDRDPRAPDALELVDDLVDRDAGPQAERDEARDAFRERRGVAAAAADLCEHLEQAFLVLVDRHVQRTVSGEDLLRPTGDHVGTGSRPDDRGLRGHFDVDLFRLARLRDADVQDLVLARAVAVDRYALAL